jgi:hypothetical protein
MDNEITEALHGIMHMRNPLAPCVIKGVNKEKQFFFFCFPFFTDENSAQLPGA